jgi:hypothetical protein
LASDLAPAKGDRLVVLHQLGNHGPNYFERYPDRFKRFMPSCENPDLGKCTVSSIVNAYDNAVLYTDYFLAGTISLLEGQSHYDAAMIYVSDHGESLGENGLFLHGIPYAIAPDEQLEVPMVVWLSRAFLQTAAIEGDCLQSVANRPVSHDNLFSSILGLLDIETTLYSPHLDVFQSCRTRQDWSSQTVGGSGQIVTRRCPAAVDHFEDAWRGFFVPRITSYRGLSAGDFARIPRFAVEPRSVAPISAILSLLGFSALMLLGAIFMRKRLADAEQIG